MKSFICIIVTFLLCLLFPKVIFAAFATVAVIVLLAVLNVIDVSLYIKIKHLT